MLRQLRPRLLISALVTALLILTLLGIVIAERLRTNERSATLVSQQEAAGQARELSLYVQYNAHDTNAYTLGHVEHREEYAEHSQQFSQLVATLRQSVREGIIDEDEDEALDTIEATRARYDAAAEQLFLAADANRLSPSPANQAALDAAWEAADQLGDQLDEESRELARRIGEDVARLRGELATQNQQMIAFLLALGGVLLALIALSQWSAMRALGAPLRELLAGVQRFTEGDHAARVASERQDEIGTLARAFNTLAATIQQLTDGLRAESAAADSVRQAAEQAQAQIAEQLRVIQNQQDTLRTVSVPVLPLTETTLVLPLVGNLDSSRLLTMQTRALEALEQRSTRYLIIDVTGVPLIDTAVAKGLVQLVHATQLLGSSAIVTGMRPEVANALVTLGVDLRALITMSSLQRGIQYVLGRDSEAHAA